MFPTLSVIVYDAHKQDSTSDNSISYDFCLSLRVVRPMCHFYLL